MKKMDEATSKAELVGSACSDPVSWVHKYADSLYRFAFLRLREEELAKDMVQETFLAALQQSSKFEGKSSEKTWLIAILKNKIVDYYRKQAATGIKQVIAVEARQDNFFEAGNGHWNFKHSPKSFRLDDDNPLLKKELGNFLSNCLKKLPPLWFSVFSMKHIDDLDTGSICHDLEISDKNYWVIMHRTKLNLRACLQKYLN